MSIKFFAQFLIEQGEVDGGQIREALELLDRTNRSVGQIAVEEGMLSQQEAEEINRAQRRVDKTFGDLAVGMGLLSAQDLVTCLRFQRDCRLRMGEALVRLGHLTDDRLGLLLDLFKADQAPYQVGAAPALPDALANNRVAPYVLDLLPKLALRVARLSLKLGPAQVLEEAPVFAYRISLPVLGPRNLEVTLVGDGGFCRRLAAATAGLAEAALDDDLVKDGVGEFLNVLCGNAMSALERSGVSCGLGVPDYDAELADGWLFDMAASHGRAALVLAQFA